MPTFAFRQVDVFTGKRLRNPLAVVIGADRVSDDTMAALARVGPISAKPHSCSSRHHPKRTTGCAFSHRRANYRLPATRRWAVVMSG